MNAALHFFIISLSTYTVVSHWQRRIPVLLCCLARVSYILAPALRATCIINCFPESYLLCGVDENVKGALCLSPAAYSLLPLVRHLHGLLPVLQRHSGRVFLCRDSTRLSFVFDEGDTAATRHHTDFAETLEATEYAGENVLVEIVWQVLDEQRLVGW